MITEQTVTERLEAARERLLSALRQDNVEAVLDALLTELVTLEGVIFDVHAAFDPSTAVGEQLTFIGRLVGEKRGNLSDAEYRPLVRARIQANRSSGTVDELLEVLRLANGEDLINPEEDTAPTGEAVEQFPARIQILSVDNPLTADPVRLGALLKEAVSAGVALEFVFNVATASRSFAFAPAASLVTSSARGFDGETGDDFDGGFLSGVLVY